MNKLTLNEIVNNEDLDVKVNGLIGFLKETFGEEIDVVFFKKDGSKRNMRFKLGVPSKTGQPSTTAHIKKYVTVFDVVKNDFRNINLETVDSIGLATV